MSNNVKTKISLFQKDSISYSLVLFSIIFELVFSVKILDVIETGYLMGVSTLIDIILLFLLFSCAVKVNVYKIKWAIYTLGIAVYAFLRTILIVPFILKPTSKVGELTLYNLLLVAFLSIAGIRSLIISYRRKSFMETDEAKQLLCIKEQ